MATIDRFKDAVNQGKVSAENGAASLSAQMKYDYLAAIHTMEEILSITKAIENRNGYRQRLRNELLNNCRQSLSKIVNEEELTIKKIDAAIKVLTDCKSEIAKIDSATKESTRLAEYVRDGISAGH
ncbi:MAG: hypothetical protein K6G55_03585 [Selenomonadaceae bacterium]|nr:hypothetical protein [Selenomonadaceae bacterium]